MRGRACGARRGAVSAPRTHEVESGRPHEGVAQRVPLEHVARHGEGADEQLPDAVDARGNVGADGRDVDDRARAHGAPEDALLLVLRDVRDDLVLELLDRVRNVVLARAVHILEHDAR